MTAAPPPIPPLPGVDDVYADTASRVLDVLSARDPLWKGEAAYWLFRGQADATWKLLPASMRGAAAFRRFAVPYNEPSDPSVAWSSRAEAQGVALSRFFSFLKRGGIDRPGKYLTDDGGMISNFEVNSAEFPGLAMAQHYGIPTKLLDFSRRGWVAAYFAAEDAARKMVAINAAERTIAEMEATALKLGVAPNIIAELVKPLSLPKPTHFAVWALHRSATRSRTMDPDSELLLFEGATLNNANLAAQSGALIASTDDEDRSIDEWLANKAYLKRVIVPVSLAGEILRMLSEEGVDGASMFPGVSGAWRAMQEMPLWDRTPEALFP